MQVPDHQLVLTKHDAATRQVEAAIDALSRGDFDVAITLAGAAEQMFDREGRHLFAYLRDHAIAEALNKGKEWVPFLNLERNWLKHPNGPDDPDTMRFGRSSAAFMIARAASKLGHWSPKIDTFARWYEDSIEELTAEL